MQQALLAGAALAIVAMSVLSAGWRPLWYDELFTLYVASEPSLGAVLSALTAGVDTNPPLDYLLRHVSMAALGSSAEAFRLPSAVVFLAGLFAVYGYVRRRTSFVAAAAAFVLPISTAAAVYTHEGRAYALLFASAPIALWAWQRACERPRDLPRLAVLVLALCMGPFSHYLGVLNFPAVAAGEAWRSWRRRQADAPILGAICVALVLLVGLLPFARTTAAFRGGFWASAFHASDLPLYYVWVLEAGKLVIPAVMLAAGVLAVWARRRAPRTLWPQVPGHELVAALVLVMTPVLAFGLAKLATGALTAKYTLALVPGLAIVTGYLVACAELTSRRAAAALAIGLGGFGLYHNAEATLAYRGLEAVPGPVLSALRDSSLPVAFDSPHKFLEFEHYVPAAVAGRFVYPMDAETALRVRHFNNDEIALRNLARIRPLNILDYQDFKARNREFLLVYDATFWPGLERELPRDGFCLVTRARSGTIYVLDVFTGCWPTAD